MTRTLLRTDEVSEKTGIPVATLRWYRHSSQGPQWFRLGARRVVYDEADVDQWIEECRAASPAAPRASA